jgi:hypothetical protein
MVSIFILKLSLSIDPGKKKKNTDNTGYVGVEL